MSKASANKRRKVYVHDAHAEDVSLATTAWNTRVEVIMTPAPPPSPEKPPPRTYDAFDQAMGYSPDDDIFMPGSAAPVPDSASGITIKQKKEKARRYDESDRPILPFIRARNEILDGLVRREGRGPWWSKGCMALDCLSIHAEYRCEDCFGGQLLCAKCMVEWHRDEPLHIIQKWDEGYFQPCTLSSIAPGLRYQVGHPPGEECDFRDGPKKFVVLDNNGIHRISIDFCGCLGAPSMIDQLINIGWFPATLKEPETCATLSLLRRFHTLNLQGRVPAYDFYSALEVLSDRAGQRELPDRREQFTFMTRTYRHLQMCKRAGRAHDGVGKPREPGSMEMQFGIEATKRGELAIPCRACPQPGINLPDESATDSYWDRWIYQLMLSEDANFKMKGRATSSREKDPTLGPGYAYMVASDAYLEHLSKYMEEDEISHCVAFAALWRANNKRAKGLRASGIGSVSCSRHELFRANGTGDLQRGERYSNMDYLFFSCLVGTAILSIVASYNIACQWFRNFWTRMLKFPPAMRLPSGIKIQFKVPKFHLPPHRNWAWLNMIARSISVMGPGAREDTIDDFCGYANWRKTVNLGNSLLRKMALAIPQAILHSRAFHAFTDGLRDGHTEDLEKWEKLVREWEQNHDKPCPYEYPEEEEITMDQVRLRIAQEEHEREAQGPSSTSRPGAFIIAAMEVEERQCVRTSAQATELQRKRTVLLGLVRRLRDEQAPFMPGLARLLEERSTTESSACPEEMQLHLPSSFPAAARAQICISGLPEEEERLRATQAKKALGDLRRGLRIRTLAHQFRRRLTASQATYTKSQALQSAIEQKIKSAATTYNTARAALLSLRGPGPWEDILQVLHQSDIRGMNERTLNEEEKEDDRKARIQAGLPPEVDEYGEEVEPTVIFNLETGEGRRRLSWIWYTESGRPSDCHAADDSLDIRIEWTKARARADRWREELILLDEEMRRVLQFCQWKAAWWDARRYARRDVSPELAEGLCAYATEQAARERYWLTSWTAKWSAVRDKASAALGSGVVDVMLEVPLEVEVDDDVAYGEYAEDGGEADDDLLD
ncbi:hypothetical protein GGX14DRAFT_537360 [Mycena pura]|uniref:CxC2-like cysteine cluster KDZ transposase-associated domain-containing protein n=1 Tax=Mycena pura TaxID=153505 RepID=A0AAD6Y7G1_9AGAR|nr:hypothetical protein GGX14DRAFT_537360 [Mycena pura]